MCKFEIPIAWKWAVSKFEFQAIVGLCCKRVWVMGKFDAETSSPTIPIPPLLITILGALLYNVGMECDFSL